MSFTILFYNQSVYSFYIRKLITNPMNYNFVVYPPINIDSKII